MQSLEARADAIAASYNPPGVGRPSDIGDAALLKELLQSVRDGNYLSTACDLVGVSTVTVNKWVKRGEAGERPFDLFVRALKEASARAEAQAVANVRKAGELPQFWAAEMTYLERRHPDRWGKRQDDTQAPRVVVQIGVGQGEVKVGIIQGLSPESINELPCGNPSQVEMLSPINRDYVNQPAALPASAAEAIGESLRSNPEGDPTPVGRAAGGQPRRLLSKGRAQKTRKKARGPKRGTREILSKNVTSPQAGDKAEGA